MILHRTARPIRVAIAVLSMFVATELSAEPSHEEYEHAVAAIGQILATGASVSLDVVVEVLVLQDGDSPDIPGDFFSSARESIKAAVGASSSDNKNFNLVGIREEPYAQAATGSTSSAGVPAPFPMPAAAKEATELLVVRIVGYHSGAFDLYETRSALVDLTDGRRLASDIEWTSRANGVIQALFVNGWRTK